METASDIRKIVISSLEKPGTCDTYCIVLLYCIVTELMVETFLVI